MESDLKGTEQSHVVAEGVSGESFSAQHGGALLSGLSGKNEGVSVGECAGDGEDGVQTLQAPPHTEPSSLNAAPRAGQRGDSPAPSGSPRGPWRRWSAWKS